MRALDSDDRLWFKNQYGFSKHRNVDLVLCRIIQFSLRRLIENAYYSILMLRALLIISIM